MVCIIRTVKRQLIDGNRFKTGEVSWSCARSTACECKPALTDIIYTSSNRLTHLLQTVTYLRCINAGLSQWLDMWYQCMRDYAARGMSNVTDRLPAIAGLAAAVQSHVNNRYLFGLWENETLLDHLLWFCVNRSKGEEPPNSPVFPACDYAPTWSWASCSIEGSCQCWHSSGYRDYAQIWQLRKINIELNTPSRFGPGSGTLQLHSLVIPITRQSGSDPRGFYLGPVQSLNASEIGVEATPCSSIALTWGCYLENGEIKTNGDWYKDARIDYIDSQEWYQSRRLYFIFSGILFRGGLPVYFEGLLLELLDDTEQGLRRFRRLGYIDDKFATPNKVKDGTWWAPDTMYEPTGTVCRATWEYWQKIGTWETIALV